MSTAKFTLSAAILVLCALVTIAHQSPQPEARAKDETSIRENVKQLETGWNTKSGAAYARPFAEDADYIVINGWHIQGRQVIEKSHQQIFETIFKDSTISLTVKQIRFLRPDVALVHVTGHNKTRQGEAVSEWDLMVSLVMVQDAGAWKIASFQNTRVDNQQRR